ncbi:acyltransferase-like protein [Scenedesmus sp. PABB004]|nr:acyltransferase-like protein [Scenedesmus sp. PABB004]
MQQLQARRGLAAAWRRRTALRPQRGAAVVVRASSSPFKVRLLHPVRPLPDGETRPLLLFLPGTDGTGQAITPQLPGLLTAGYDVRTLYIPSDDRSGWEQLQAQVLYLIATLLGGRPPGPHSAQLTLVAESFGGCLALRLAAAAPQLFKALVLLNPATSYNQSLSGLSAFVSSTNLLGLFPQSLYNTAQAVLMPLLVDVDRVGDTGAAALRSMIMMDPPPDYEALDEAAADDDEQDATALTIAAERRRRQTTSSAAFSTSGTGGARPASPGAPVAVGGGPRLGAGGRGRGRVTGAAGAAGLFTPAAGTGAPGSSIFAPAAAANFRSNLLRTGNLPDATLRRIAVPALVICSAKDRMLPSITEGARLTRLLPNSRRVILPDSGHAALLEQGMDLAAVMRGSGITPTAVGPTAAKPGAKPGAAGAAAAPAAAAAAAAGGARRAAQQPALLGVSGAGAALPQRSATVFPASSAVAVPVQQPAAAAGGGEGGGQRARTAPAAAAAAPAAAGAGAAAGGVAAATGGNAPAEQQAEEGDGAGKDLAWDEWAQVLQPWRDLVSPVLLGQEHLPALVSSGRPLLFVGPHGKMGLYDMPLLTYELYMRGFKVRGLAHPSHWGGPLGPFFEQFGAVPAGPLTAFKLLKRGEQVLLFPGGAREVNKRVGDDHTLLWRDAPDFVRLAARCGAVVVPFAAVGADDAFNVAMEVDELLAAPLLGDLVKGALRRVDPALDPREAALPLTRLPGTPLPTLVPIPNLQRLYFKICQPVDMATLGLGDGRRGDARWQEVYDDIRATVVAGMEELQAVRAADDQRDVRARLSKAWNSWLPAFDIAGQRAAGTSGSGDAGGGGGAASPPGDRDGA